MNYAFEMDTSGFICIPSSIKMCSGTQKFMGGYTGTPDRKVTS
jgi:hypothetical protein